ncbi:MAG: hypothetical protein JWO13_440 [Acidobacteriales bacterium]|nr:hypothetical protein [Terriglobales bacterium]
MYQFEFDQLMQELLQKEVSLIETQSFEILIRIEEQRYAEALVLANTLRERPQFICHLLTRHADSEEYEQGRTRSKEN